MHKLSLEVSQDSFPMVRIFAAIYQQSQCENLLPTRKSSYVTARGPLRSKFSLFCPGRVDTPILTWVVPYPPGSIPAGGGYPILGGRGGPSVLGYAPPPGRSIDRTGVPPSSPRQDQWQDNEVPYTRKEVGPETRGRTWDLRLLANTCKIITVPHPSDAGGNYFLAIRLLITFSQALTPPHFLPAPSRGSVKIRSYFKYRYFRTKRCLGCSG